MKPETQHFRLCIPSFGSHATTVLLTHDLPTTAWSKRKMTLPSRGRHDLGAKNYTLMTILFGKHPWALTVVS